MFVRLLVSYAIKGPKSNMGIWKMENVETLKSNINELIDRCLESSGLDICDVDIFALADNFNTTLVPSVFTFGVQAQGPKIYFNPQMERGVLQKQIVCQIFVNSMDQISRCDLAGNGKDEIAFVSGMISQCIRKFAS